MNYDNNMKGVLFINYEQREGKKDPDRNGSCEIDGVQYWVDGWLNESNTKKGPDGKPLKFLSLKFKPKEQRAAKPRVEPVAAGEPEAFDDDIPFD